MVPIVSETQELDRFFEYLYGEGKGSVYVARKNPVDKAWKQSFFSWPSQRSALGEFVIESRNQWEVYVGPSLYDGQGALKGNVLGAQVFWCEFDGNAPKHLTHLPEPTLKVQSSGDGHEHWYWKLDKFVDAEHLETVNRAITYLLEADASGWDSTQVLRPPLTFNHKRQKPVTVISASPVELDTSLFNGLPQPPPPVEIETPESIPPVEDVILRYQFPQVVSDLFKHGVPIGGRSEAQMRLGYYLAEMNLSNEEMLSVLLNADNRWGKFKGRNDQLQRLLEIVTIARQKHPLRMEGSGIHLEGFEQDTRGALQPLGFLTLLKTEVNLEWVWQDYLQRDGYMLMTGPSGIGKTQVTLDAAAHLALGLDFLGQPTRQSKVGMLSLEMGLTDVKHFMQTLQAAYTPDQQEVLEENFLTFPLGEALYLDNDKVLSAVDQLVGDLKLEGLFIDSLGQATAESLGDEKFRTFFQKMEMLRKKHNCFTWFIHHHRKANGDNKKPNKLADVFGSQYITSSATSVFCLWKGLYVNSLQVIPLKVRLSKLPDPFHIHRDENLHFSYMAPGVGESILSGDSSGKGNSVTAISLEGSSGDAATVPPGATQGPQVGPMGQSPTVPNLSL